MSGGGAAPAPPRHRLRRTASRLRASMAHRVPHSGGSSRQAPRGPAHIAAPVRGRRPALAPRDWRRGDSAYRPRTRAAELLSPEVPALRLSSSWPASFNSLRLEQLRQPLARVEHPRLDRVFRNANDLSYLFDRFLVVVHEIDHLPMFRRKSSEALSQQCTLVLLLQRSCGIVRQIFDRRCSLLVQLIVPSAPERRNGLEARDRQQPGRYRRAPFEPASLTPHVEKYLADHVLRGSLIANETNDEPKHPHMVARKQHLHSEPVAVRDSSDQHLVCCRLHFGLVTLVASDQHWVHASARDGAPRHARQIFGERAPCGWYRESPLRFGRLDRQPNQGSSDDRRDDDPSHASRKELAQRRAGFHPPRAIATPTSAAPMATIERPVVHGRNPAQRPNAYPHTNTIAIVTA